MCSDVQKKGFYEMHPEREQLDWMIKKYPSNILENTCPAIEAALAAVPNPFVPLEVNEAVLNTDTVKVEEKHVSFNLPDPLTPDIIIDATNTTSDTVAVPKKQSRKVLAATSLLTQVPT